MKFKPFTIVSMIYLGVIAGLAVGDIGVTTEGSEVTGWTAFWVILIFVWTWGLGYLSNSEDNE